MSLYDKRCKVLRDIEGSETLEIFFFKNRVVRSAKEKCCVSRPT